MENHDASDVRIQNFANTIRASLQLTHSLEHVNDLYRSHIHTHNLNNHPRSESSPLASAGQGIQHHCIHRQRLWNRQDHHDQQPILDRRAFPHFAPKRPRMGRFQSSVSIFSPSTTGTCPLSCSRRRHVSSPIAACYAPPGPWKTTAQMIVHHLKRMRRMQYLFAWWRSAL